MNKDDQKYSQNIGIGLALGAGIGVALGAAFGNIAMGVALGVAMGLAFGSMPTNVAAQKNEKQEVPTVKEKVKIRKKLVRKKSK